MKPIHYFFKMFLNVKQKTMTSVPNPITQMSYLPCVLIPELITPNTNIVYSVPILLNISQCRNTHNQTQTIFKFRACTIILLLSTVCELKHLSLKLNCILHLMSQKKQC